MPTMSYREWLQELGDIMGGYSPEELIDDGRRDLLSLYNSGVSPREAADILRFAGEL